MNTSLHRLTLLSQCQCQVIYEHQHQQCRKNGEGDELSILNRWVWSAPIHSGQRDFASAPAWVWQGRIEPGWGRGPDPG
jgi:hypothetical protein